MNMKTNKRKLEKHNSERMLFMNWLSGWAHEAPAYGKKAKLAAKYSKAAGIPTLSAESLMRRWLKRGIAPMPKPASVVMLYECFKTLKVKA